MLGSVLLLCLFGEQGNKGLNPFFLIAAKMVVGAQVLIQFKWRCDAVISSRRCPSASR